METQIIFQKELLKFAMANFNFTKSLFVRTEATFYERTRVYCCEVNLICEYYIICKVKINMLKDREYSYYSLLDKFKEAFLEWKNSKFIYEFNRTLVKIKEEINSDFIEVEDTYGKQSIIKRSQLKRFEF